MKITKEIVERIEGEAVLELEWEKNKINFAKIKFFNYRGLEQIMVSRPLYDALVITPRVCGICSSAHANASILAIEDCYTSFGENLNISAKAKAIREIVLNIEKIHNHIKWYYFTILPELKKIDNNGKKTAYAFAQKEWFEAQKAIVTILKAGSIFSGQWPHASFLMAGGVTCDPLRSDVTQAQNIVDEVIDFCEEHIFGMSLSEFLGIDSSIQIMGSNSSLSDGMDILMRHGFDSIGRSFDKFIALGESYMYDEASKAVKTTVVKADVKFVSESLEHTFFESKANGYTYSKSAMYKKNYFEVGPMARLIIGKDPLIRDFHRRFKDSVVTRVVSRVAEIAHLLNRTQYLLRHLDISQVSCKKPKIHLKVLSGEGVGAVEGARGSLIHRVRVKEGIIKEYDIITPTVWNLGNGSQENPSIAQEAIIGIDSISKADIVFKSFDVCSVCTTQ
ncbi:MAG: nickel-dependent hydrogenase large subunit [Sulfurospirillaceae bacterium]|nr:nickel-dependent hydrogenase large subunit [Sulfurospirillaceae bacterium]